MYNPQIRKLIVYLAFMSIVIALGASIMSAKSSNFGKPKIEADLGVQQNACNNGYGFSCFQVAHRVINDNFELGRAYYYRACMLGFQEGCDEFAKISDTPDMLYYKYWQLWDREKRLYKKQQQMPLYR